MTTFIPHTTVDGDRWDLLAWHYYGDATAYEQIIAANPDVPIWPVLPANISLLIPVQESTVDTVADTAGLPPWLLP